MKRFGRIENGEIREIIEAKALPPFHPEIANQFVELPEDAEERDRYEAGKVTKPVESDTGTDLERLTALYNTLPQAAKIALLPTIGQVMTALALGDSDTARLLISSKGEFKDPTIPSKAKQAFQQLFNV